MQDLLNWLAQQKGGIGTYLEFQNRALELRATEPENAALLRLMADLAGRFVESYDREPLPLDVAEQARERLTSMLKAAVEANTAPAADRIALLNKVSESELA